MADPITDAPPITPQQVKHIKLIIGTANFAAQVNAVEFKKNGGDSATWQGGTPDSQYVDKSPETYTVDVTHVQDWEQEDSLCNFLLEHDGEKATLVYMPKASGRVQFTSEITISAPLPPAKVGDWPEVTVSSPCTKPVLSRLPVPGP